MEVNSCPGPQEGLRPSALLGYEIMLILVVYLPASCSIFVTSAHYSVLILQVEKQAFRSYGTFQVYRATPGPETRGSCPNPVLPVSLMDDCQGYNFFVLKILKK